MLNSSAPQKYAESLVDAALEARPDSARAHAVRGDVLRFEDRWEDAGASFARAVELDPDDALNHLDQAEFLSARALLATDADERKRLLSEARKAYVRSSRIEASGETYAMYGATFLAPGEDPTRGHVG